jgi:hypothetical protein
MAGDVSDARTGHCREIIAGYQQLIDRAHLHGIKVIGATLTPFEGSFAGAPLQTFYNPEKEKMRQAVNEWIRQRVPPTTASSTLTPLSGIRNIRRGFGQNTMEATIYIQMMPGTKQWGIPWI